MKLVVQGREQGKKERNIIIEKQEWINEHVGEKKDEQKENFKFIKYAMIKKVNFWFNSWEEL